MADAGRFAWLAADAARMPLDTATVDVATAAFTLDVVDDRAAVLAEIARVLRPGGRFGMVGWIGEEVALAADAAFDEAVRASRVDVADAAPRALSAPDVMSVSGVRDELAAAGFVEIDARAGELCHAWTPASYLEFKQHFDEHELFDSLVPSQHRALVDAVTAGWSGLPAAAFELRAPIVCALARTPG